MQADLLAITGPIRGAVFRLHNEDVSIGRHGSNQFCIADASVSRRHSVIKTDAGVYKVVDAGSHNGTYVNGESVTESLLRDGDTISIGDTVLRFNNLAESVSECRVVIPGEREEVLSLSTVHLLRRSIGSRPAGAEPGSATAPVERKSLDVSALADITRVLDAELPLEDLSRRLFDALYPLVPADAGAVLLAGAPGDPPATIQWSRIGGESASIRISPAIVERTLAGGEPVLSSEPRTPAGPVSRAPSPDTGLVLSVPLSARGKVLGLIYLQSRQSDQSFNAGHLELVRMLAGHIGLALDAARRAGDAEPNGSRPVAARELLQEMVGAGPRMRVLRQKLSRIAVSEATVLVLGETGTGKELAARAIHRESSRARRAFETVNCALLKDNLLESELFGHEKGAFTGAVSQRRGRFEIADGGTIFLDEIGELPESTQSMLLRVLQERSFHRLGGERLVHVDVRVVAATNKDLQKAVQDGAFRSDLYYRLNVVSVLLPPLRERREDIPHLAEHFLRSCSAKNRRPVRSISNEAMSCLQEYDWPGNVRELENAIEYAVVFGYTDEIQPEDLPDRVAGVGAASEDGPALSDEATPPGMLSDQLKSVRARLVREALEKCQGNYTKAAKLLGVHPNNLHRLVRSLKSGLT